jgi:hypothetical protein
MFVIDWILAKFNYHKFHKVDMDALWADIDKSWAELDKQEAKPVAAKKRPARKVAAKKPAAKKIVLARKKV